ncbi:MAG TPA: SufD family Fe-S cluster assembly protein, partial [Rhizomicrobium sp.]|nr:SufD family Fe-S cluster assembly protein [Rhizomicrobium sp.]
MTLALNLDRKAAAAAVVHSHGVPHRRIEEWKYSDLKSALGEKGLGAVTAGWLVGNLPSGVELFDLAQSDPPAWVMDHIARPTQNVMRAASLALSAGGVALRVPKGARIADPLKLDFTGPGHVRGLLVLEAGASLTLVEGVGIADFRNVGFEIVLGEGASLEHVRISPDAGDAVLVEEASVHLAARARYRAHFAGFGSKLSRMELEIALEGEGAQAHLSGVAVLDAHAHSDVTTHVIHRVGNTNSTQLFKHVASGQARAVYQGKVTVAKGADGSDS